MTALWQQIARDPNLLSATVFGGCLLVVGLISVLWFTLFQQDERRLRRRLERLHAAPRAPRADEENRPIESVRRNQQDSSIASLDRLIKRTVAQHQSAAAAPGAQRLVAQDRRLSADLRWSPRP